MLLGDCSTPGVLWLPAVLRVGAERATAALVAHEGGLCVVDRQAPPPQRLPQVLRPQFLQWRLLPAQMLCAAATPWSPGGGVEGQRAILLLLFFLLQLLEEEEEEEE